MTKTWLLALALTITTRESLAKKETCDSCCDARSHEAIMHMIYLDHVDACRGDQYAEHCAYVAMKKKEYEDSKAAADKVCKVTSR